MVEKLTWTFSSKIESERLWRFLDRFAPMDTWDYEGFLQQQPLRQTLFKNEDVALVHRYLRDLAPHQSAEFIDKLISLLSRPDVEQFFFDTFLDIRWPLPDVHLADGALNRYVSLLSIAVHSDFLVTDGWPFGRLKLWEFDEGFGNKTLGNVMHSNPLTADDELDPFRSRRFIDDLVEFGRLLTNFADQLDDEIWSTWLSIINEIRTHYDEGFVVRRLNIGIDDVLSLFVRSHSRSHLFTPKSDFALLVGQIEHNAEFWRCVNSSIERAIPTWAHDLSRNSQRLAGLIMSALENEPFTRHFVRLQGRLVECDFDLWSQALGGDEKGIEVAFRELDRLRLFGDQSEFPFFFNT